MPKHHPAHKRIQFSKLDDGYCASNLFKQGGHNAIHLSERCVEFCLHRGAALSRLQRLALDRYHNESIFNLATPSEPTLIILNAYAQLFNELFFFGSLRNRVNVMLNKGTSTRRMGMNGRCKKIQNNSKILDTLKKTSGDNENWKFQIELFSRDRETKDRSKRLLQYIHTLIHELIHAFLNLWTCSYDPCRQDWEALGVSGHGKAWQDIAYAVEKALNDESLLNLKIDMCRESSLALELIKEGTQRVTVGKEDLRKWRLSEQELRNEFHRLEKLMKRE